MRAIILQTENGEPMRSLFFVGQNMDFENSCFPIGKQLFCKETKKCECNDKVVHHGEMSYPFTGQMD